MKKQDILKGLIDGSVDVITDNFAGAYLSYVNRVRTFIESVYGNSELKKFDPLINGNIDYATMGTIRGYLEGLLVKADIEEPEISDQVSTSPIIYDAKKVFIVHGHDAETKETVARFVQKIGLKPIILHEQPNSGLTIIEKLESFSNVGFAVVLLTPDDVGGLATDTKKLQIRARQNVILELGYFIGKLSRNRVCALYKQGVEIPSDYGSVVFIELDEKGGWRTKLAQEFVHSGMAIEIEGLLEA